MNVLKSELILDSPGDMVECVPRKDSRVTCTSVSHIFATRYSHFEDWKVGVIAFKIERQTHLTL